MRVAFLYVSRRGVQKPEAVVLLVIYSAYVLLRLGAGIAGTAAPHYPF